MSRHSLHILQEHFNVEPALAQELLQESSGDLQSVIAKIVPRVGGHDADTLQLFVSILHVADAVASQWNREVDNLRTALVQCHIPSDVPSPQQTDIYKQYMTLLSSLSIDKRHAPQYPTFMDRNYDGPPLPGRIATFISGVREAVLRKVVAKIQQAMPSVTPVFNGTAAQRIRLDGLRRLARAIKCRLMYRILGLNDSPIDEASAPPKHALVPASPQVPVSALSSQHVRGRSRLCNPQLRPLT